MTEKLRVEFSFAVLSDEDLIDVSSVQLETPTYENLSSMYFLPEDHTEKIYSI